jgi:flagellar hook-length control protein FliK
MQMLPIEIGMQAVRGVTSFQIRLDPAELGRVDVRLDIKQNGEVNASLVVDRVETLQMLRRDASTLQQAFEQAGLKQSPDGLNFSLRGEGQQGHQHERGQQGRPAAGVEDIGMPQMGELVMRRALISNSSLDLMI